MILPMARSQASWLLTKTKTHANDAPGRGAYGRSREIMSLTAEQTGFSGHSGEIKIFSQDGGVLKGTPDDRADEGFRLFGWGSNARGSCANRRAR